MAITSYNELQTAILNWMGRPSDPLLTPIVPDWVTLSEALFNRKLRTRAMETRATATVNAQYTAVPTDFLAMRNFQLNTDPVIALELVPPEYIDNIWAGSSSGKPKFYAIVRNEIQLAPSPDGSYTAEMDYWAKIPALSGSAPTNWLLAAAPDLYLFAGLIEGSAYVGNDDDVVKYGGRLSAAMQALLDSDRQGKWSGATPMIRVVGMTVS